MGHTESIEMYLETVYILEKSHGHAHVVDIAKYLGVSKPSVSKAMKVLKGKGLIHQEAYGSITLSPEGLERSKKIYREHQMIAQFLQHSLGLSPEDASSNACKMEHVLNNTMIEAITAYLVKNSLQ